jgi:hypothetical protein
MLLLGDWQLHRAESGNELSWAYTFEWPLFAAFTVYFWIKSLRDELREHEVAAPAAAPSGTGGVDAGFAESAVVVPAAVADVGASASTGSAPTAAPAAGVIAGADTAEPTGPVATAAAAGSSRRADSWDATSWDATSWAATGVQTGADGASEPVDVSRATPADGEAYVARLKAEVQRSGRRGRR